MKKLRTPQIAFGTSAKKDYLKIWRRRSVVHSFCSINFEAKWFIEFISFTLHTCAHVITLAHTHNLIGSVWFPKITHCLISSSFSLSLPLSSAERGRREGPDADLDRRGRHPSEGHRRVDVGLLFARDVLPHEAGTGSVVVREPARAVHGAAGAAGLWQVVLR